MNLVTDGGINSIENKIDLELLHEVIAGKLDGLPLRERLVIIMHFGLNGVEKRTYKEIAREIGTQTERVRQLQEYALRRLRYPYPQDLVHFL